MPARPIFQHTVHRAADDINLAYFFVFCNSAVDAYSIKHALIEAIILTLAHPLIRDILVPAACFFYNYFLLLRLIIAEMFIPW